MHMKKTPPKHKWTFTSRFRKGAYGWSGSQLACKRLKEALSELKKAGKSDPVLAAEGVVLLIGKLVPALAHINSSTGTLGSRVAGTLTDLVSIITIAEPDGKTKRKWLQQLWDAYADDGYGYLDRLGDYWGELCSTREFCDEWIDKFMVIVSENRDEPRLSSYVKETIPCLSCMLQAGRHQELMELLGLPAFDWWPYRQFGVKSLIAQGKTSEALRFAEGSRGLNQPDGEIDAVCEDILLSSGFYQEAYDRYALSYQTKSSYAAWLKDIIKRYPMLPPEKILNDLIESSDVEKGKWFAAAKDLKLYDLAVELVQEHPCDPATLNRAAQKFRQSNTPFSFNCSLASLKWLLRGYGYEITLGDVYQTLDNVFTAAELLGQTEVAKDITARLLEDAKGVTKNTKDIVRRRLTQ